MGQIRVLDRGTVNQIAAGEVVERPASVVKELVENSIDAGASRITIEVEEGGKALVRIRDNGCGMAREDALVAFEKHATSKIRTIGDLQKIVSLGFRGEGLSSIASVSQTTMITRPAPATIEASAESGTLIEIDTGEVKKVEDIGCPVGTTITVENLFLGVPARLKYLKSNRTELRRIIEVVASRALAFPGIFFELTHEKRRILMTPGSGDLLDTMAAILGKTAAREMLSLERSDPRADVSGYLSRPSYTRAASNQIHILINRRPVRSPLIVKAIREGYGDLLPPVRHPVGVVNLTIDPGELGVNIHPAKSEVKFQYPKDVAHSITQAVARALRNRDLSPRTSLAGSGSGAGKSRNPERTANAIRKDPKLREALFRKSEAPREVVAETGAEYGRDTEKDEVGVGEQIPTGTGAGTGPGGMKTREMAGPAEPGDGKTRDRGGPGSTGKQSIIDIREGTGKPDTGNESGYPGEPVNALPPMRPIGQISDLFILAESDEGLVIIDQHAAHEKVMYERLLREHRKAAVGHQRLIEPIPLELAPEERETVRQYGTLLEHIGFTIEEFGGNTFMVRTIPVLTRGLATPEMVYDLIDELVVMGKITSVDDRLDDMLKLLACHSAIRGGEELTIPRIEKLLGEMYRLDNPFTCPHGRPTLIRISRKELEKKFKRTGF